jgi:glycosyltransferase involved in cell wall biosynthesis
VVTQTPNFAVNFIGDGFSTSKKIMGRQSAGKALMRGMARRWQNAEVGSFCSSQQMAEAMLAQLRGDGFSGKIRWHNSKSLSPSTRLNSVYYPAPPTKVLAHVRNRVGPRSYSIFGVTHTLSSMGAMDQLCDLILPPFQPWDGLICTSQAAIGVVEALHAQARDWWARSTGANRFVPISIKVIPLGVNVPDLARNNGERSHTRASLEIGDDEVCFLFAGRMTFHAKSNPVAFYSALELACNELKKKLVCIEAGIYPNDNVKKAFEDARALLAPSARFISLDGADQGLYDSAWSASDVFVSLSDNIQETFGITPIEAMAAGLPVIVTDWNGYKDTVREGLDGFRIPVTLPASSAGEDLMFRYDLEIDTYDYYIGRVSMATVVDVGVLAGRIVDLASSKDLRESMGQEGQRRAQNTYDWPIILDQYVEFARELELKRKSGLHNESSSGCSGRPDPFDLFAHYPTKSVRGDTRVTVNPYMGERLDEILGLAIGNYVIEPNTLPLDAIERAVGSVVSSATVDDLLDANTQFGRPVTMRAIMWLAKMGIVKLD